MKKSMVMLLALAVVAGFNSTVWAQPDSTLWFDVRGDSGAQLGSLKVKDWIVSGVPTKPYSLGQGIAPDPGPINAGGRGAGQILRIAPKQNSGWHLNGGGSLTAFGEWDGDGDYSTGHLWLYMDVNDDVGDGDVISSLGIDMDIERQHLQQKNYIKDMTWEWDTPTRGWPVASNAGKVDGAMDAETPPNYNGLKAVKVPVEGVPPAFAVGVGDEAGLVPTNLYRLGKLNVEAGTRACGPYLAFLQKSTYELKLTVNNLLITRVFQTPGDATEWLAFGYGDGSGELPDGTDTTTWVDGSLEGDTSVLPDAIIRIQLRSDFNGNGSLQANDLDAYIATSPLGYNINQQEAYTFDYNGNGTLQANDLDDYIASVAAAAACP